MSRWTVLSAAMAASIIIATGCSSGAHNPATPTLPNDLQIAASVEANHSQTHLWGFYDVYIDIPTQTATAVLDRSAMFAANVTQFINGNPANLSFNIIGTSPDPGGNWLDVDIDVGITHPFPGLTQYNGYDVRGVFIGEGSTNLQYNPSVIYAVNGTDQCMLNDPTGDGGGPDGYTRWYNPPEFTTPGLFGYTKGLFATPAYEPTATLNPYRYFADGLGSHDDLWTWLQSNSATYGVFSAGQKNTRNYYLRFPTPAPGVKFAYAIVANWEAVDVHPANAVESIATSVVVTPDAWYDSPTHKGGDMILDVSVYGWNHQPSKIYIESNVLTAMHAFTPSEMTPTGSGTDYATYHADIPANDIMGVEGNWFWIIAEYQGFDYSNDFGVPNYAGSEPLVAYFRYDLPILSQKPCHDLVPVVNMLNGLTHKYAANKPYTGWTLDGDMFEEGSPGVAVSDGVTNVAVATNVQWIDIHTVTFDIDLTGVANGTYDIVFTNGCGVQNTTLKEDMLTVLRYIHVVGTPNIDVVTGFGTPKDITCNPGANEVAISSGNKWMKWSSNYTVHSGPYYSYQGNEMGPMDSQSGFICYAHKWPGINAYICWSWADWNGVQSGNSYWNQGTTNHMVDLSNQVGGGDVCGFYDWADRPGEPATFFMYSYGFNNLNWASYWYAPFYNGSGSTGIIMDNLRATALVGSDMLMLEYLPGSTPTAVIERWRIGSYPATMISSWGEGVLYDPLDITLDTFLYGYILDRDASGRPIIWAFANDGVLYGTSDVLTTAEVSGDPLRMDVALSMEPDEVHVLHTLGVTRFTMW